MRQFAIGDIHGCLTALERLDRELCFQADDVVVTLGDYVDRGPDSCGVLDHLIALRSRCQLITLRGNHEVMMLGARDDRSILVPWLYCGGQDARFLWDREYRQGSVVALELHRADPSLSRV